MNKRILLTLLFALTIIFSISAISAGDVNATDSYAASMADDASDMPVQMESTDNLSDASQSGDLNSDNDSSRLCLSGSEVLESENSNTLSNDSNNNDSEVNITDTIKASDITKYYKGSTKYTATFTDIYGNALANTGVKIVVNGVTNTATTNSKGVASLAVNLKPGTYKVVATNPSTGYQLTTTFKILSTIKASDITKVYTDSKKFTATFLKSDGKALANKNVKFKINGKTYTVKTNGNGVASLSVKNLKKGTYKIISYNTDGLTKTNKIKVVGSTTTKLNTYTYTFLKSDTKKIKAQLLNGLGYAPGAGKVIKFTVNGKTYTSKTNSKGFAYLTLPSMKEGTYTVKYAFSGNSFYKASSASNKLYVIPSKTATFTVKSTTTFGYGSGNSFSVALTSGSVPLVGKTVTLSINGENYTKTTNSNGIVTLAMNYDVGNYTISYKFAGDSKVNAKSGSSQITIKERSNSTISWSSGTFEAGSQTFKVVLRDASGTGISSKTVKLTIDSKTYSATTSKNGYATFNLNLAIGNYTALFTYDAVEDNNNLPCNYSRSLNITKRTSFDGTGYGYWLFASEMKSVNLAGLASQGTTDVFLNYYAFTLYSQSTIESWIASANSYGIRVHIWMQAFYDGSWINPIKNGAQYTSYFNKKIDEAKKYASVKGVAGIHFDYLRYPGTAYKTSGGTAAISNFAKLAADAIHSVNSSLIVSCAVMPETTSNIKYYGQDITALSKCMDVLIPMMYKGNYGKSSSWITTTTKWFVENSKGAAIWAGLQGYKSDDDMTKLSPSSITSDAQAAINGNASGVVIFRYGVTNLVDFNSLTGKANSSLSSTVPDESVPLADVLSAVDALKSAISSTGTVPSSVSIGEKTYSTSQFLYIMAKAVDNIGNGETGNITVLSVDDATNSNGDGKGEMDLAGYLDVAARLVSYIAENGQAPNYATSTIGNIKYENLVDAFSRVLAYYKTNSQLPNSVSVGAAAQSNSTAIDTPATSAKAISIKDILTGASNLKTYYSTNSKLPNTVSAGGITFTLAEFIYLMSQAIYQIGNSNSSDIAYLSGVNAASSPSGDSISSQQLTKENYLTVAFNVAKFIKENNQAPNYASSAVGKIIYSELVDSFSRILAYYNSNGALPNYVVITYGSSSSTTISASGSGLNQKNTETDVTGYLKSTTNCQVGNSAIKSLVNSLTSGLTSDLEKAKAIYNYVRDSISYSFYYNTKYGAAGTLSAKTGNCVDQAHLLIAMYRTAGLAARYVHGTCTFSDGTFGHVWAQVLVDGTWYVVDPTSSRNSFGNVVNWNTKSFSLKGIYSSISF